MTTYPTAPVDFPSAFNGFGERMLHPRIAIWSHLKSDYQIYQVHREDYPAIQLIPTNSERTTPFYFAEGPCDTQSRTFTLYRPRARIHSHISMAIWHTGGWLCRKTGNQLEAVLPILSVSDPGKLAWVGNVGILKEQCEAYEIWVQFQTPFFTRSIIHNRILPSAPKQIEETKPPTVAPVPFFVAEALLGQANQKGDVCAISMEPVPVGGAAVTSCFHVFQREALAHWHSQHGSCPVCKAACAITEC